MSRRSGFCGSRSRAPEGKVFITSPVLLDCAFINSDLGVSAGHSHRASPRLTTAPHGGARLRLLQPMQSSPKHVHFREGLRSIEGWKRRGSACEGYRMIARKNLVVNNYFEDHSSSTRCLGVPDSLGARVPILQFTALYTGATSLNAAEFHVRNVASSTVPLACR